MFVLRKLQNKTKWIAEPSIVKTAIPIKWKEHLTNPKSVKTKVKTGLTLLNSETLLSKQTS